MVAPSTAFDDTQFAHIYPNGIEHHYWNLARNWVIYHELRRAKLDRHRLLEIGCGRGSVVQEQRAAGVDLYGVELAMAPILSTASDYVWSGISSLDLEADFRKTVNGLLMLDVIEHLEDTTEFIQANFAAYPNAEKLLITVPARQELWSNYDEFNAHFRRYTLPMMQQTADATGLRLAYASYFFHSLYVPAYLLIKGLHRQRSTVIKAPQGMGRLIHRLLAMTLLIDYRLLPKSLPGSSIVAVLTR